MHIEVTRYRKPDGYLTRYWSVMVNGELLAVTLYRKGAESVAQAMNKLIMETKPDSPQSQLGQQHASQAETTKNAPSVPKPAPSRTDSLPLDQTTETMLPLPESESARRKRRRKGLLRKILGDCPFVF